MTTNTMLKGLLALALALALAGCALTLPWDKALPGLSEEETEELCARRPRLWMAYYPYEKRGDRPNGVRPLPDYTGWTEQRMRNDLARMHGCGVYGVAVALTPAQLAASDVMGRLERMAELTDAAGLKFTVLLTQPVGAAPLTLDGGNLASYLDGTALARSEALVRYAVADDPSRECVPVFLFDSAVIRIEPAPGLHLLPLSTPDAPEGGIPLVRVGDSGGAQEATDGAQRAMWPMPRRRGRELLRQLHTAVANGAHAVLLHSWNRYGDGSFAEPNTLDGPTVTDLLRRVLRPELVPAD